jgi:quercetin dioxygenase-like cupin family protein
MRGVRVGMLAAALAFGALAVPGAAQATPASGVSATLLSKTTRGGNDYIVRRITIQPGGTTGWHYHDGMVYGYVASGRLTHVLSDCSVDTYRPGGIIREASGPANAHVGRNLGPGPTVLFAYYVLPTGSPLSEDAPDPGCGS